MWGWLEEVSDEEQQSQHSRKEAELMPALGCSHRCSGCSEVLLCLTHSSHPALLLPLPHLEHQGEIQKEERGKTVLEMCSGAVWKAGNQDSDLTQRKARGFCSVTWVKCSAPGRNRIPSNALREGGGAVFYFQPWYSAWEMLLALGFRSAGVLLCAADKAPLSLVTL